MITKPLARRLERFNEIATREDLKFELILIGGTLGTYLFNTVGDKFRPTTDVDVIVKSAMGNKKEVQEALNSNIIHDVMIVMIPPKEEFEFITIIEDYSNVKIYVPNFEYFALTKLFSNRPEDQIDLEKFAILDNCKKEKLIELVEDLRQYVSNDNDMDQNYKNLEELFKLRGI